MKDFSAVMNAHPSYIENLYQSYLQNPDSIDESWKSFFLGFDLAKSNGIAVEKNVEFDIIFCKGIIRL